jgi:hypothetical protein
MWHHRCVSERPPIPTEKRKPACRLACLTYHARRREGASHLEAPEAAVAAVQSVLPLPWKVASAEAVNAVAYARPSIHSDGSGRAPADNRPVRNFFLQCAQPWATPQRLFSASSTRGVLNNAQSSTFRVQCCIGRSRARRSNGRCGSADCVVGSAVLTARHSANRAYAIRGLSDGC